MYKHTWRHGRNEYIVISVLEACAWAYIAVVCVKMLSPLKDSSTPSFDLYIDLEKWKSLVSKHAA
jgi:predicted metal-binding membrane protein